MRTFTIGTTSHTHNEADRASEIAEHLSTVTTSSIVTADDAQAVIPTLPAIYDEPFADSSQIPTLLVSQMARRDVTVSLSGDGGDEVFGGYNRYRWIPRVAARAGRVPAPVRTKVAKAFASGAARLLGRPVAAPPRSVPPQHPRHQAGQALRHHAARFGRGDVPRGGVALGEPGIGGDRRHRRVGRAGRRRLGHRRGRTG